MKPSLSSSPSVPLAELVPRKLRQTSSSVLRWLRFRKTEIPRGRGWTLFLALVTGYCLAEVIHFGSGRERSNPRPSTADVTLSESFSEVQAVKAELDRLRQRYVESLRRESGSGTVRASESTLEMDASVTGKIEFLIEEFSGTDQAVAMVQTLLINLGRQEEWDRWLDVYLGLAYQHPTTRLVAAESERARRIARQVGREAQIERAILHVAQIPSPFATAPEGHPASVGTIKEP